ncbi:TonB-dependent receptor (plasmid) [Agrobacterium tumefaciens]|uniref:TonB-dependent receptor domain-containing protein n=1 Tax=Agrobacterium tumefaciens TaxID=358 RepID=UPI0009BA2DE1|nr:TonB-dependent receptor [Agrobacterium tumefaciens]AYM19767.1 TonB-dependent receptor [Agrobacterium tumefaciens]AYM71069.1 TonB-dependent receptor [Agrobacterium tumefaciens]NIB58516.1 TonB-dependent receptor [Agrobacterium tumefaciens]NSZ25445.1 TonB-dependent receptor [Agrobacterium tumefaciens]NSZ66333.1 TonB-dependent receptor [Agrobacterium tumefaciens]
MECKGINARTAPTGLAGWVAMLLATSVSALAMHVPAAAQGTGQASASPRQISIAAGPLTSALNQLATQTGLQIMFDGSVANGKRSRGATGNLTPPQALDAVLAGTGVQSRFAGQNQIVLTVAANNTDAVGSDGTTVLQAITIYGARNATTLASTSSSIGIVTAQEIADGQIHSFRDSFRRMANVMDADWVDGGFIIRGVNSEGLVPGGAPLASLYVDGVQQTVRGARRGARGLFDVEQVEVYRGPQSTLSGRAAMAGAVYIKTKDPTFEKEAEVSATIGTGNLYGTAFMVNTPLMDDQLAVRISGEIQRSENDINYPTFVGYDRYNDFTHDLYYQIRGKVLFEPAEMPETRALFSYSFSHDDPYVRDIGGPAGASRFRFDEKRGDYQIPAYIEYRPTEVHNVGLEITHDFSDELKLTSLSTFSYSDTDRFSPNYGTAGEINTYHGYYKEFIASQELRLNYEGDKWDWVGGVYFSYEDEKNFYDRTIPLSATVNRNQFQRNTQKSFNAALFGEATYEFVPTWKITLGGRLDYTDQDITQYLLRTQPLGGTRTVLTDYAASFHETNFVPKIGLSKELTDTQTVGVTYSQGFRTGGASYDSFRRTAYTYEPETASTYELFYKGTFLDDRLTLNSNIFYTKYSDQQVQMQLDPLDATTRRIINAASSEAWGFEFEPSFKVTDNLETFASLGYVHTEFKDFNDLAYGNLSGLPFPEAPEWSLGLGARYTFDNGVYVGADAKYTSSYLARLGSLPHDYLDSRWIVNLQAGYKTERWELNAFAQNLLDEEYFVYNDNDIAATLGERRSVGLNLKVKF